MEVKNISLGQNLIKTNTSNIERQINALKEAPFLRLLCNSMSGLVLVLNSDRRIVFYNNEMLDFFKIRRDEPVYGKRIGELLGCSRIANSKKSCGESQSCKLCGIFNVVFNSVQKNKAQMETASIVHGQDYLALDLSVKAVPINIMGEKFTIFSAIDISSEKRKKILEKIFFHDILNTITSMQINVELLRLARSEKSLHSAKKILSESISQLILDVNDQKILAAAENSDLTVNLSNVCVGEILNELKNFYGWCAKNKKIKLVFLKGEKIFLKTDKTILLRVLGNMIKNAIEASKAKDKVVVKYEFKAGKIKFYVHNPTAINKKIQLQLFQKSFSTKGEGRGIGTYSMKLLGERYLKGKITFTSNKKNGTTFIATFHAGL